MDFIKTGYAQLVDLIIRPPRFDYEMEDLGPRTFRIGSKRFQRTDLEVTNDRNQKLRCSHFEPAEDQRPRKALPCVIYLHGNSGCRLDSLHTLEILLPYNITLFCLDLSGSGLSEGDYISLGYYEKKDVECVVNYLRASERVSRIGIWGRSMGAATAIMYGAMDPSIACLILDSPFSSLNVIAQELVENAQVKIPKMMVSLGLKLIRKTIKNKAKFDINELAPVEHVECSFIPALFVHGKEDNFILPHHSKLLHEKYAGDKNLILVDGDHNSPRPPFCYDSISIFLSNTLLVGEDRLDENFHVEHLGFGGDLSGYVRRYHQDVDLIASLQNITHGNNHSGSGSELHRDETTPPEVYPRAAYDEDEMLQRALMESMLLNGGGVDEDDDESRSSRSSSFSATNPSSDLEEMKPIENKNDKTEKSDKADKAEKSEKKAKLSLKKSDKKKEKKGEPKEKKEKKEKKSSKKSGLKTSSKKSKSASSSPSTSSSS